MSGRHGWWGEWGAMLLCAFRPLPLFRDPGALGIWDPREFGTGALTEILSITFT